MTTAEWEWNLETEALEKAEVVTALFALVFTGKSSLRESQAFETNGKVWSKDELNLDRGGSG